MNALPQLRQTTMQSYTTTYPGEVLVVHQLHQDKQVQEDVQLGEYGGSGGVPGAAWPEPRRLVSLHGLGRRE